MLLLISIPIVCFLAYKAHELSIFSKTKLLWNIYKNLGANQEEGNCVVNNLNENCLGLKYDFNGTEYSLLVPINRRSISKQLNKRVFLIRGDDKFDITQQPGVKYFFSGKDLGGQIYIEDLIDEEIIHLETDMVPFA